LNEIGVQYMSQRNWRTHDSWGNIFKNESSKMPKTMQFLALKCKLINAPPKNQNVKFIFVWSNTMRYATKFNASLLSNGMKGINV
jgi:hypothetical protein